MRASGGRVFQAVPTACAKALGQEYTNSLCKGPESGMCLIFLSKKEAKCLNQGGGCRSEVMEVRGTAGGTALENWGENIGFSLE